MRTANKKPTTVTPIIAAERLDAEEADDTMRSATSAPAMGSSATSP